MYYVGVTCLRLQAFISICDLLIVFSRHLATTAPQLDLLIVDPDRNLQGALSHFLSEAVFITEAEGLLPSTRLRVVGHPASSYKLFVFQVRSASCCIVVATSWRASASSSSTTSFPSAWLPTSSSTTCAYVTTHLSLEWTPCRFYDTLLEFIKIILIFIVSRRSWGHHQVGAEQVSRDQ